MRVNKALLFIPFICFFSCQSELAPTEYLKFLQNRENGLNKESSLKGKNFKAQIINNDWYIIKEKKVDNYIKENELGVIYTITSEDGMNPLEATSDQELSYYEKLALINQKSKEIFYLEDEKGKSYDVLFAQVEVGYDVSSHLKFMLIFEKPGKAERIKVIYNDIFWGNGPVKLSFLESDIKEIPELIKTDYDSKVKK